MRPEVLATFTTTEKAEAAAVEVKREGFRETDITLITTPFDVGATVHTQKDYALSLKRGLLWGAIAGFGIGLAQLIYIDSPALNHWPGVVSIPLWTSFGWALFGGIVGGSGALAKAGVPASVEHHYEETVGKGQVLLSVQLNDKKQFDRIAAIFYAAGATDVQPAGTIAA